ncbi:hypothetical protein [Sorangium sp. So ce1335]|uniref:hypothetical protein n=1 Tax=Sorangium sp. So ce1335 TaxID=3133335 RepID=UPI003F5D9475
MGAPHGERLAELPMRWIGSAGLPALPALPLALHQATAEPELPTARLAALVVQALQRPVEIARGVQPIAS